MKPYLFQVKYGKGLGPPDPLKPQDPISELEVPMDRIIAVITTVDSHEAVERISRTLLEERLIACAQVIGPITSAYWWKDRVEQAQEWLALMKTRETLYEAVERRVREMHPYELPEIVGFGLERGLPGYLQWVRDETIVP